MTAACTVDGGYRIYHHPTLRHIELPPMDLLTFLFGQMLLLVVTVTC